MIPDVIRYCVFSDQKNIYYYFIFASAVTDANLEYKEVLVDVLGLLMFFFDEALIIN